MLSQATSIWQRDSQPNASGRPGAVQTLAIGYTYDNLGRLKGIDYPSASIFDSDVTYSYDNLGRMTQASDTNTHTAYFGYDALGRVTTEGDANSARTMLYDASGRRTRLTWPDGRYVTYQYNDIDEMKAILESGSSTLATFEYDAIGRRTSLTRGNGVVTSYSYDGASRLECLRHDLSGGGALGCAPALASGQDQALTFAYNAAGQIKSRTGANDAYAFSQRYNVSRDYAANALNQYTTAGSVIPAYDLQGNLKTAGAPAAYSYSTKNELIQRDDTGVQFYHDPIGRLDSVLNAPGGSYGLQYADGQISNEFATVTGHPILRRYVYGPNIDEPIVWYEGADFSSKRYLLADERGSIIGVTDSSGTATAINSYDEYGIPDTSDITNKGRFRFTGQAWLPELGMYSFKARIYSPTWGRFVQTDPSGYFDGLNWYSYAQTDPINLVDPTGTISNQIDVYGLKDLSSGIDGVISWRPFENWQQGANGPRGGDGRPLTKKDNQNSASQSVEEEVADIIVEGFVQRLVGAIRRPGIISIIINEVFNMSPVGEPTEFNPPPADPKVTKQTSPIWKGFRSWRGATKTDGNKYYEWDHTHSDIEVYNARGQHLGSMHPFTGQMIKQPVSGRTIDVR